MADNDLTCVQCAVSLSQARLCELLTYSPDTGSFVWRENRRGVRCAGKTAGKLTRGGYRSIKIDGRGYLEHRLAWLYVHGEWPTSMLDHINRQKDDNRVRNLRLANHSLNMLNAVEARAGSRSGHLGVRVRGKRFSAALGRGAENLNLGTFDSAEEASAAYVAAKALIYPGAVG